MPSPPDDIAAPFKVAAVGPLEPIGSDDVLYAAESYTATPAGTATRRARSAARRPR